MGFKMISPSFRDDLENFRNYHCVAGHVCLKKETENSQNPIVDDDFLIDIYLGGVPCFQTNPNMMERA